MPKGPCARIPLMANRTTRAEGKKPAGKAKRLLTKRQPRQRPMPVQPVRVMTNVDEKLIDSMITEALGADVLPLIRLLKKRGEYQELILAEKMGVEVNALRNMLYRLSQFNLVKAERRRDPNNGWHVYWWRYQEKGFRDLFGTLTKKSIKGLQQKLDKESSGSFYQCATGCVRLEFDDAFGMDFRCPECGDLLNVKEKDTARIKNLQDRISHLKSALNE